MNAYTYKSTTGNLLLISDGPALVHLCYEDHTDINISGMAHEQTPVMKRTMEWLDQYFDGLIPDFTPEIDLKGSAFQKKVWEKIKHIPYGTTITYKQLAESISPSMSAQAVGHALSLNPVLILVPCHRVIGTNGSLCGYAGGPERKEWLLKWERSHL